MALGSCVPDAPSPGHCGRLREGVLGAQPDRPFALRGARGPRSAARSRGPRSFTEKRTGNHEQCLKGGAYGKMATLSKNNAKC